MTPVEGNDHNFVFPGADAWLSKEHFIPKWLVEIEGGQFLFFGQLSLFFVFFFLIFIGV